MGNTIESLNILLKKNYDMLKAYKKMAESSRCSDLSQFFNQKVNERYVYGNQLKFEIKQLNGLLYDKDELKKISNSKSINLGSSTDHVTTLLKTCERQEKKQLKAYSKNLKKLDLNETTQALLQTHYNQINSTLWTLQLKILKHKMDDFVSGLISKNAVLSY